MVAEKNNGWQESYHPFYTDNLRITCVLHEWQEFDQNSDVKWNLMCLKSI